MKRLTVFWFDIAGISRPTRWLVIAASLLIILGAKIWSISVYGSATPFWDQWDAEAIGIYRPYVTGTLRFTDLVVPHNEHRILLPKLVALGLFVASGRWDPLLQMICNAVVHTAAVSVLLIVFTRGLDRGGRLALAFFAALAFALPYGAENTLAGFQLQFYLLILLGPLAVFLLYDAAAWSAQWWVGTAVGLLSYFTIATGALTLPAFVGLASMQLALGRRSGRGEWMALGFHLLLSAALIYDIPTIAIHAELRAQSPADFLEALTAITSWPIGGPEWRIGYRLVAVGLIFAPVLLTGAKVLRRPPPRSDPQWTLLGLAAWIGLQLIAAAYGRGLNALASRYLDIFLVGIVLNAACLFHLIAALPGRPTHCLAGLWLLAVLTSASQKPLQFAEQRLAIRRDTAAIQTENLKRFLATGDRSALEGKPIPYPSPDRLIAITSDPAIRAILPPHLLGQTGRGRTRDRILRYGPLLIPFGVMLFMLAMLAARPTRAADET